VAPGAVVVIIVNYGTPELTITAAESALASQSVDVNVVLIDNASPDDSVAQLNARFAGDTRVVLLTRSINDGFTGGNNAGMAVARERRARYAFLLNSDAVVEPGCLRRLLEVAEGDRRVALAVPRIFFQEPRDLLWYGGGRFSCWRGRAIHVGYKRGVEDGWVDIRDATFASGCALLVRIASLRSAPLFDETLFAFGEDLDLSLRTLRDGGRILYVPAAVAWHVDGGSHQDSDSGARRFYLSTRNTIRVVRRHARWYHWPLLGPSLAVDVVGRYCVATLRRGEWRACVAVLCGALHAVTGRQARAGSELPSALDPRLRPMPPA
jgi:GT2 family glycosyltransferase